MKKISVLLLALGAFTVVSAQDSTVIDPLTDTVPQVIDTLPITDPNVLMEETEEENKQKRKLDINQLKLANRSKDHLLIQVGFDGWSQMPDSINTGGLPRSFNMYFMFDFPFKTNPHLSVAIGAGIGTNNMYFKDTYVDITGKVSTSHLTFRDDSDTTHFKKNKLLTSFLEAPVELRYMFRPENPKKSLKIALGAKVGTMLAASYKGKTFQNTSGQTLNAYTLKEKSKRFMNTTRIAVTGRIGFGNISLHGVYQVNNFIKEGFGPDVRPYSIGITLSGL